MHNVVPSPDCIKGIKQCQGVELDSETGEYTRLIQHVTDPAVQCEEYGETGWSKFMVENRAAEGRRQRELELEGLFCYSERERRQLLEAYICKATSMFVHAYHESHRAALDAFMEIFRQNPDVRCE